MTVAAPRMMKIIGVAALGFFSLLVFEIETIRTFGVFTGIGIVSAVVLVSAERIQRIIGDRLVVAANLQLSVEKVKFNAPDIGKESMADLLLGVSYRVANNWTAGMEYRFHNDFDGYAFNQQTQRAHFIGPNVHYATKDWWMTAAWRYQLKGQSQCWEPGAAECSNGRVWDSHSRNEVMFKFGRPF